jgi:hypothetical protein
MQRPDDTVQRRIAPWVVLAAALLGVAAWFLLGNRPVKKTTRAAHGSSSSALEVRSRVTEPPSPAAPQVSAPSAVSPTSNAPPVLPGAAEACPPWQPGDGESCQVATGTVLACGYGHEEQPTVCRCGAPDAPNHWKCPPPGDETLSKCDPSMPEQGTSCSPRGQKCHYGAWPDAMTCECGGKDVLSWACKRRYGSK